MTDSSGSVVWAADYKPFGEATVTVLTITNNLRFPGQYYDVETGLNYNFFRDYNPVIGRYIEADPIGIQRGYNHLFAYTDNNPLNYDDPDGLCPPTMPGMKNEWVYKMWGPNKANEYKYQRQTKEKLTSKLTSSSGTCDCSNKTLTCSYDILDSWHSRIRSYNKKTKQYGDWDEWDASSNTPGFDDRVVKKVTIRYNCKDGSYYFGSS